MGKMNPVPRVKDGRKFEVERSAGEAGGLCVGASVHLVGTCL